jgi:UDP-3-O-[3-hydroxymyristoyl] glucosamine N-acyltransferase
MITANEVSLKFGLRLIGDGHFQIDGVGDPRTATSSQICFVAFEKYLPAVRESRSQAWIISPDLFERVKMSEKESKVFFLSDDPFLSFVQLVHHLIPATKAIGGVHALAFVDPKAIVDPTAQIDAFVSVQVGAEIGRGVILHPHVWVGAGAKIGDESVLFSGAKVYPNTIIGKRCILHSSCVIGADGFGFIKDKAGNNIKIPQVGRAVLGDDIEIGASSAIDRGALDDTSIGDGTKIDNLVQIGHSCKIGKNNLICAMAGLSGHTTMGDNCLIAGHAGTKGHLKIGDNVRVGAQSGVTKDLPSNSDCKGYPARPLKEFLKTQVLQLRLPEIYKRLVSLENHIEKISFEQGVSK